MRKKKRILILSEGFGAGHTQAAYALSDSLRLLAPHIQSRVLELGTFLHPTLAPLVIGAYRRTVTTQPKLYGLVYRSQDRKTLNRLTRLALHRICYAQTAAIVRQLKPDAIVCTHPFPSAVISRLKRFGLEVPLYTVITDYDAHGTWVSSEVNTYLVSTPGVKHKLESLGIPPEAVQVTGIPVHPNFWQPHNRDELRARFGLRQLPTVLVMGGGWGLLKDRNFLHHLLRWREQIQLVLCLGSNHSSLRELAEDPRFRHPNIRLLGFTKEVSQWMDVSDLLITKPGGMTCTEALAKGIPMLFHKPIPGQEERNLQYFTQMGFGEAIRSAETVDLWFRQLIDHYPEMEQARSSRSAAGGAAYSPSLCSQAIMEMVP
ncbi:UDP-N-acetylglucosamine--LPS N-acetylglucosamine transferase [Paenibacillus mucilaginosus]|uniref:Monogalactosyldiacylglycerol synthase n=1 Tax=Paenibacillus mucilaginosus (strain KNP414) TaxID=1036673 RepID=F8FR69_PAEMK|nr:UDP-N-acetylglucosamine--LPS N-acetylglucosamine transferase [Paenibacillus mucilaginosus]AEI39319.1 monogalactosyldiacylglycerol synthase [Paenibacillus mucilaginosus KNP414]MCG7216976.1 UDP-N-acetylglucosamine--LPS N-acetylglucosamine transferase [Paenibacillus mucilaginosus]WDM28314.1 UDP-N-acetylglucosamine--LPS N-acetylglucosamine transferase [Paenibacillus mucilaginosus]